MIHTISACLLHSIIEVCGACCQGRFVSSLAFAALLPAVLAFGAGQTAFGRGSWLRLDIQEQRCAHSNGSIQIVTVPVDVWAALQVHLLSSCQLRVCRQHALGAVAAQLWRDVCRVYL